MSKDFWSAYALRDGRIVHVDCVENGLACNCVCPSCNARMVARHGKQRIHHFAHYNAKPCETGYQTAVHMRAKEILSEMKFIALPSYEFNWYTKELKAPPAIVKIADVALEKRVDDIIPDVIVTTTKGQRILVEIYVTHKIDEEKLAKIKRLDIPTIEIDLSGCELNDQLLIDAMTDKMETYGKWVYYGKEDFYKDRIRSLMVKLPIEEDGSVACPLLYDESSDKGHPLKGYAEECISGRLCKFFLKSTKDCIYCLGKDYFSDLYVLKYPVKARQEYYMKKLNAKDAMKKIERSLRYFVSIPLEQRKGRNHPINKLKFQQICSIETVADTGSIIPRMKVSGVNTDGELVHFYVNVINSAEAKWLWGRKWYRDFVEQQGEMVVFYEEVYDDYSDKRKYKMTKCLFDPQSGEEELPIKSYFADLEEQNYVTAGGKQYADCHHLFHGGDVDHSFVSKELCQACPRNHEGMEGIDFFCTSNPKLEDESKYALMNELPVANLSDEQKKVLERELRGRGVIVGNETSSFLEIVKQEAPYTERGNKK